MPPALPRFRFRSRNRHYPSASSSSLAEEMTTNSYRSRAASSFHSGADYRAGDYTVRMQHKLRLIAFILLLSVTSLSAQTAAPKVTTPQQFFGHEIGADYVLPNYTKFTEFVKKLDAESDRMIVQSIGKTAEGRDQLMAIITSPENHKNLQKYKDISRRLALAEGLTEDQGRALARDGKAVVWIDGGLHATEVLGAQQLTETIYQLVSKNDPETLRFLRDVIILAVHVNP